MHQVRCQVRRSFLLFHFVRPGLQSADLRLAPGVAATYLYLGSTEAEAQQVAADPGRGGLVILDPWHFLYIYIEREFQSWLRTSLRAAPDPTMTRTWPWCGLAVGLLEPLAPQVHRGAAAQR